MTTTSDDLNNKICDSVTTIVGTSGPLSDDTIYELYKDYKKAGLIDLELLQDQDTIDPMELLRDAVWQSTFQILCKELGDQS